MGRELGLDLDIINAAPTDGLWADGRTDEDQLGMSYPELEAAMQLDQAEQETGHLTEHPISLSREHKSRLRRYREIRARNMHKMMPIPVCKLKN